MKELKTDEDIEITERFELAVLLVKSLPQKGSFQPSYAEAAKIYSFFKQAKFGPCNIPRPGFWDYINRAKWDAWAALGQLSQTEAMKNYVDEIKGIYLRVKELDEFQEREHEFADVLIPFCQTNNIQMSHKLLEIVNKRENVMETVTFKKDVGNTDTESKNKHEDTVADNHTHNYKLNGENGFLTEDESINGNINDTLNHEHSILVENTILTDSKSAKFGLNDKASLKVNGDFNKAEHANDNESSSENISDKNSTTDDEEVYCDPIDPETISKVPANESSMITTDSGTHFEEVVRTNKRISVRKRNDTVESSSDSHNGCLERELEKPYKSNRARHYKKTMYQQHAMKSHKRFDGQAKAGGGNNQPSNGDQRPHSSRPSQNTAAPQPHHSVNLNTQRHNQGDGSDSSGNYSSSSTYSTDTIGLKIVNALERMEDNMESILARLDSIEDTIKEVTRPKTPWWQQYMPSRTVLIWTVWPVIVNIMFYIYWKRFRRQKIKKC